MHRTSSSAITEGDGGFADAVQQTIEQQIKDAWYDVNNGFSQVKLLQTLKKLHPELTVTKLRKLIKQTLDKQESKQLFVPIQKSKYPMSTYSPFHRVQIDLCDLTLEQPNKNDGMKFCFLCIDTYTRIAFAVPIKNKTDKECLRAFKLIVDDIEALSGFPPIRVDSDKESAFLSKPFQNFLKKHDIYHDINRIGDHKALSFIDSFTRTFRRRLESMKIALNTPRWVDKLENIINAYNHTIHSSIKITPIEALSSNQQYDKQVSLKVKKARTLQKKKRAFVIGDRVRHMLQKSIFEKGTRAQWSKNVYTIERIQNGQYYLTGVNRFYRVNEIQLANDVQ